MLIWRIELFANKDDKEPMRVGYTSADTQDEAMVIATNAMKLAMRASVAVVKVNPVNSTPKGVVFWE